MGGGYSGPIAMSDETLEAIDLGVFERVIESMIERHKGQANVANMTIAQIEHAKSALAEGLAGEVVQYVSNIRYVHYHNSVTMLPLCAAFCLSSLTHWPLACAIYIHFSL